MFSFRFGIRSVLLGLLATATCVAGFAIYNRYFDGSGGTLCEQRDAEIALSNKQMCISSGIDIDVFDPRHIGRPNMILIKYREGILYECFWFDSRRFNYSEDGWERPFFEHCLKDPRNFEMRRKALR
jgi:hypothetical protein